MQNESADTQNLISFLKQKTLILDHDNNISLSIDTSFTQAQLNNDYKSPKPNLLKNSYIRKSNSLVKLPNVFQSPYSNNFADSAMDSKLSNSRTMQNLHKSTERKAQNILKGLDVIGSIKYKMSFTLKQQLFGESYAQLEKSRNDMPVLKNLKKQTQTEVKFPSLKHKEIEQQIKEMKLRKIDNIQKTNLRDYTIFNYKIDTILNDAYGYIKTHNR